MGFTTGCQQHFATADSKKKGGRAWPTTGHALDSINPPNSFARSAPHLGCTSGPCPHVRGLDAWISRSLRPRRTTLSTRAWARLDRLHQLQEPSHLVHTCVGSTPRSCGYAWTDHTSGPFRHHDSGIRQKACLERIPTRSIHRHKWYQYSDSQLPRRVI